MKFYLFIIWFHLLFDFIHFLVNNSYLIQINRQHEYADKSRPTASRWLNQQILILWWTILVVRIEYGDKSNDWFLRLSNSNLNLAATDCPRPLVLSHSLCLSVSFFSFSGAWSRVSFSLPPSVIHSQTGLVTSSVNAVTSGYIFICSESFISAQDESESHAVPAWGII